MRSFFLLFCLFVLYACSEEIVVFEPHPEKNLGTARTIVVDTVYKTAKSLTNSCLFDGKYYQGQGVAVIGNIMFRLFNPGYCQTYDISDIAHPKHIATFELASLQSGGSHCNAAQIRLSQEGDTLLYIAGLGGRCFVERVSTHSSELIQTISLPSMALFDYTQRLNMICGDDGYLWLFGESRAAQTLYFAKTRLPRLSEGNITLTIKDIYDFWSEPGYIYSDSIWQGGMIYDGNLYYVFGTGTSHRHIAVYNIYSHEKTLDIDLNYIVSEEPEDCDFIDDKRILLSIYGGKGAYIIKLQENNSQ